MADSKVTTKKSEGKSRKPQPQVESAKAQAARKAKDYETLVGLRQDMNSAQAVVIRCEFKLNSVLNTKALGGTNQEDAIDDARKALNASREEASRSTQAFEVAKFEARVSEHR